MINCKIKKYNPNKYLLPEAVIRVENYTKVIVNHFNSVIKNEFKNEKITMHNFCDRINPYFTKYNIVFSYSMLRPQDLLRPDMQDGIVSMETGSKSFQIKINICLNALNIFKQDGFLGKVFLPSFKLLLNHELVHRIQFIKNKSKYIQQVKSVYDNFITYDELMTYACQTVEEFRFAGIFGELPKAKAFGLLASTSLLFSKFKRIFKKSYILSTSVNSLCTTGTILKKFYDRKVFSICQLPTFKKFQRTNLIISTLKLKGFFVKKLLNLLKNKFAVYPKPKDLGFTACFYNFILQEIKKTIPEEDTVSSTFNFFNSKEIRLQFPKQYKQYLKYIYEYIKGNINKNNYSFIENVHQSEFKEIYRKNVKGLYGKI